MEMRIGASGLRMLAALAVLLSTIAVVDGSTCYINGYGTYCAQGCCQYYSSSSYSTYKYCCTGSSSSSSLYIGLGVTFGIIVLVVVGIVICLNMKKANTRKMAVRQTPKPVVVGSTVHQAPQQMQPMPPPPYGQQQPMGFPGGQYPPPPMQAYPPPPMQNAAYPPPPAYPYGQ